MTSRDSSSEEGQNAQNGDPNNNNTQRRHFLRVALTLGAVFVTGGIASVAKSLIAPSTNPPAPPPSGSTKTVTKTVTSTVGGGQGSTTSSTTSQSTSTTAASSTSTATSLFPVIVVANIKDLEVDKPISFNYPLEETPNMLVKLGQKAQGGVGPDGDIVAFSQICQHLGCIYGYVASGKSPACDNTFKAGGPVGYCCCHGSIFDLLNSAKVLDGPAQRPQPQVLLSFDSASGDISATGMGPPTIFGHSTGSDDVTKDLEGGSLVG